MKGSAVISFARAMKWLHRIVQDFRPGYVRCSIRPARAAEMSASCPAFIMYRRSSGAALPPLDSIATVERCLACEADAVGALARLGYETVISREIRAAYPFPTTLYFVFVILFLSTRQSAARLLADLTVSLAHHGLASEAAFHGCRPLRTPLRQLQDPPAHEYFDR